VGGDAAVTRALRLAIPPVVLLLGILKGGRLDYIGDAAVTRALRLAIPPVVLLLGILKGGRLDYMGIAVAWGLVVAAGPRGRRLAQIALPFLVTGLLYDNFALLASVRGAVHVSDVRALEATLFGIGSERLLPNEWLAARLHPALDLLTGFAYMTYLLEVFLLALLWSFRDEERARRLAWGFLVANLVGMAVWTVFPVAPPWYAELYGAQVVLDAPASAAGAARFDELLGISYFEAFYARSTNVFGAMPSLHVAYPVLALTVARGTSAWMLAALAAFAALVAFSAVYLGHHYVVDVLAGALTGLLAERVVTLARARLRPPIAQAAPLEVEA